MRAVSREQPPLGLSEIGFGNDHVGNQLALDVTAADRENLERVEPHAIIVPAPGSHRAVRALRRVGRDGPDDALRIGQEHGAGAVPRPDSDGNLGPPPVGRPV